MGIRIEGLCPLLEVFDMRRSLGFYRDLLGFEVVAAAPPGDAAAWALLRRGGAELMLNTAYEQHERPPAPDPARIAACGSSRSPTPTVTSSACSGRSSEEGVPRQPSGAGTRRSRSHDWLTSAWTWGRWSTSSAGGAA